MGEGKYKIITNKSIQKRRFFITFFSFLLALIVVVGIFSLATKKSEIKWLEGNNGLARENLFPVVFTSGDDLYSLSADGKVSEIDNEVSNPLFDASYNVVYYTYKGTNDLYEYSVESGSRVLLCSMVESYYLLPDRSVIPYIRTSGELAVYSYTLKNSFTLRSSSSMLPIDYSKPVVGKSILVYFDEYNKTDNTATLMCYGIDGSNYPIADSVLVDSNVVILKNDSGVCYYTEEGLVVTSLPKLISETFPSSYEISSTYRVLQTKNTSAPKSFDSCFNVKYLVSTDDNGVNTLRYFNISKKKIEVEDVFEGLSSIVGYAEDTEMMLFTREDEEEIKVYLTTKGNSPQLISTCEVDTRFDFDPSSDRLYMTSKDGTVSLLNISERVKKQFVVADKATEVYSYYGKKFAIAVGDSGDTETFIFSQYHQEQSYKNEKRLYGTSDDKYLLKRTFGDGSGMSLDIVDNEKITRICGDIEDMVIFDKKIENVVYVSKGTIFLYKDGESTKISEFSEKITLVDMVAKQ